MKSWRTWRTRSLRSCEWRWRRTTLWVTAVLVSVINNDYGPIRVELAQADYPHHLQSCRWISAGTDCLVPYVWINYTVLVMHFRGVMIYSASYMWPHYEVIVKFAPCAILKLCKWLLKTSGITSCDVNMGRPASSYLRTTIQPRLFQRGHQLTEVAPCVWIPVL